MLRKLRSARSSLCCLIGAAPDAKAQDTPNIRSAGRKLDLSELRAQPETNQVVVKFREGEKVRLANQKLTGMRSGQANLLNNVLRQAGVTETALTPLFEAPPEELERDRSEGQRRSGRELADLSLYFVIALPPTASAAEVANNLNTLPFVEYARPALRPAPPPIYSIPKAADPLPEGDAARAASPNLTPWQTYKGKAPPGIGPIPNIKGSDARGMSFADVEYDWTLTHEDLRISSLRALETELTPDRFGGPEHGTAVLGILSSLPNSFGVTGIAPGALAYVAAASSKELGYQPARAIGIAMNKLRAGDVIVIEQQAPVCGLEDYGPLEYYQDMFDAVSAATAKGIVVVAAAGNGDVNLDRDTCSGAFDRSKRDSQAIIVGAGSSTDRTRLSFSSYGSRVDVQGWGENVTTTGYGDAYNPTNDVRRYYTKSFNGTSSATPIVAGTVLVIQSVRKACGLPPATPLEMRDLLVRTGARQGSPRARNIGPLPNLEAALKASVPANCLKPVQSASDAAAALTSSIWRKRSWVSARARVAAAKSRHLFLRRSAASASSPHLLICQSSSTWAASHAASGVSRPCATARASSADPVNPVITCSAARLKASRPSSVSRNRASEASGWATCATPSARNSGAPSAVLAQASTGSQCVCCALTSPSGPPAR